MNIGFQSVHPRIECHKRASALVAFVVFKASKSISPSFLIDATFSSSVDTHDGSKRTPSRKVYGGWYYSATFDDLTKILPNGQPFRHRGSQRLLI
jgi:hypothetical protein